MVCVCADAQIADHLQFNNQENKILQERLWHIQVHPRHRV